MSRKQVSAKAKSEVEAADDFIDKAKEEFREKLKSIGFGTVPGGYKDGDK